MRLIWLLKFALCPGFSRKYRSVAVSFVMHSILDTKCQTPVLYPNFNIRLSVKLIESACAELSEEGELAMEEDSLFLVRPKREHSPSDPADEPSTKKQRVCVHVSATLPYIPCISYMFAYLCYRAIPAAESVQCGCLCHHTYPYLVFVHSSPWCNQRRG